MRSCFNAIDAYFTFDTQAAGSVASDPLKRPSSKMKRLSRSFRLSDFFVAAVVGTIFFSKSSFAARDFAPGSRETSRSKVEKVRCIERRSAELARDTVVFDEKLIRHEIHEVVQSHSLPRLSRTTLSNCFKIECFYSPDILENLRKKEHEPEFLQAKKRIEYWQKIIFGNSGVFEIWPSNENELALSVETKSISVDPHVVY